MKLKIKSLIKDGVLASEVNSNITIILKKENDVYHALLEHHVSVPPRIHFHESFYTIDEAEKHYARLCEDYARK